MASLNSRTLLQFALVLLVAALASPTLLAQNSSLSGVITDATGAVVPGVEIVLITAETGATRTALSNDEGRYQFSQVPPGLYDVTAEMPGFKKLEITGLRLQVDTPSTQDLSLELGEVSEIVTVQSTHIALMNTTNAAMGNAFEAEQIVNLPLNSRNVVGLLSVQPGVTRTGEIAGARSDQSNLTLDGIDVNDQQQGTAFESVLRVTPDSVQEFRVTTINAGASQGRSSGAQVSLVTKSGTNDFHGSLYWFHRNTVTAANNFFNNRSDIDRPVLLRNLYGGSLGGPVLEDKAFFFFNYEGRKDRSQSSAVRTVPLAHLGQGLIRFTDDDGVAREFGPDEILARFPETGGVNPIALAVLADAAARFPSNDDGVGDQVNIGGFRFNGGTPLNQNTYTAKMDFNLADNQQLFIRANYQWDNQGFVGQFPGVQSPSTWTHPLGLATGHTWTVSPTVVNTFRYGFTRQAFTSAGDSSENSIRFRFIYSPKAFSRDLGRTTPVQNITNDTSWIKGAHTFQFGTNIRLIDNQRVAFSSAFDAATHNPSFYDQSGGVLDIPEAEGGDRDVWRNALTSVLGRYSQFSGSFTFGADGTLLSAGTPTDREFATEEYEFYFEDSWQVARGLTLNLGIRYGVNTVVNETSGFQVAPTEALGDYFNRRVAGAKIGKPVNDLMVIDTAGPFYGKDGFYPLDKNNWSPRISAAWSPEFDGGLLGFLFGTSGNSVIRGGYSLQYDRIGSALAVSFDTRNTLGFTSRERISANTFNLTTNLGPLFTGFDQQIRPLLPEHGLTIPDSLVFPLIKPDDEAFRIEDSLDALLTTPQNHTWNVSVGRQFGQGLFIEASYLGRKGNDLLANRDVMHLNNFVDPASGQSWYEAMAILGQHRFDQTPLDQVPDIPFFENLFPNYNSSGWEIDDNLTPTQNIYGFIANVGDGFDIADYTFLQVVLDDMNPAIPNMFFQPQFAALNTLSTLSETDYHAFTFTARERFSDSLSVDFNWTWSKTIDWASGGGRGGFGGSGGGFADILNPLVPDAQRSLANFDMQHIVNSAWLYELPFGRGQALGSSMSGPANAFLGGWSINGVFRWNSGLAQEGPFEASRWATNWNAGSNAARIRDPRPSINKGVDGRPPNFWADPTFSYQSYRDVFAGETGDRNVFRGDGFVSLDFGLFKAFDMPYGEGHKITFRWEVFNATNTQRLARWTGNRSSFGTGQAPNIGTPASSFGNITAIQGRPREMQFGIRYDF